MTFTNEPNTKQPTNKIQQPPNTIAVGYWADLQTYKKYQEYANKLHNQIVTDEEGNKRRLLEHQDVNEFIYFAVEYFMNVTDWTQKLQKSGNFMEVMKQLVKQIGPMN